MRQSTVRAPSFGRHLFRPRFGGSWLVFCSPGHDERLHHAVGPCCAKFAGNRHCDPGGQWNGVGGHRPVPRRARLRADRGPAAAPPQRAHQPPQRLHPPAVERLAPGRHRRGFGGLGGRPDGHRHRRTAERRNGDTEPRGCEHGDKVQQHRPHGGRRLRIAAAGANGERGDHPPGPPGPAGLPVGRYGHRRRLRHRHWAPAGPDQWSVAGLGRVRGGGRQYGDLRSARAAEAARARRGRPHAQRMGRCGQDTDTCRGAVAGPHGCRGTHDHLPGHHRGRGRFAGVHGGQSERLQLGEGPEPLRERSGADLRQPLRLVPGQEWRPHQADRSDLRRIGCLRVHRSGQPLGQPHGQPHRQGQPVPGLAVHGPQPRRGHDGGPRGRDWHWHDRPHRPPERGGGHPHYGGAGGGDDPLRRLEAGQGTRIGEFPAQFDADAHIGQGERWSSVIL
mmetsp:Transcript_52771/g.94195  ORF Transcript_52771/g.94195 Transcript_52771/m.94195 type:complete len:448 (+) Transcript_52771:1405-2748(+)